MSDVKADDQDLRARWIAALRSGEYKQARGKLRDGNAMCCLGVLCDVADPRGWKEVASSWEYQGRDSYPPTDLLRKVGVTSQGALANRNDGRSDFKPHSFAEIADFIENGGGATYG